MSTPLRVAMIGATGEVGSHVVHHLLQRPGTELTLFGRRAAEGLPDGARVRQHIIDVLADAPYPPSSLRDHDVAICTLGVGEPSKVSKEQFVAIDRDAVLRFATACRDANIRQFQLLSSVGVSATSRSFYLRTKGELEDGLRALNFERLSLFHPSMIMTPSNRYGVTQAIALATWPAMSTLMHGPMKKFRGISSAELGAAIAKNCATVASGEETLTWEDIRSLADCG